jgi:5-methylcytosine-specific restriction endonuclease McrA
MRVQDTPLKTCSKCGRELPATTEFFQARTERLCGLQSQCRDCRREQHHDWRERHRAEEIAYNRSHYRNNHQQVLANAAAYLARNGDEIRARKRAHYAANSETARARSAAYSREHPEWNATNSRNRRALMRQAPGTHTAIDVRTQYDRQKGRCSWCGCKVAWRRKHVDHVVPLALGGSNGPENLVIACAHCNDSKGAKSPMEWAGCLC